MQPDYQNHDLYATIRLNLCNLLYEIIQTGSFFIFYPFLPFFINEMTKFNASLKIGNAGGVSSPLFYCEDRRIILYLRFFFATNAPPTVCVGPGVGGHWNDIPSHLLLRDGV